MHEARGGCICFLLVTEARLDPVTMTVGFLKVTLTVQYDTGFLEATSTSCFD